MLRTPTLRARWTAQCSLNSMVITLLGGALLGQPSSLHAASSRPQHTQPARVDAALQATVQAQGSASALVVLERPSGRTPKDLIPWMTALKSAQDSVLSCAKLPPGALLHRYDALPLLYVTLTPPELARLASCAGVEYLGPNRQNAPFLSDSVPLIEADLARETFGFTGKGVTVAVVDTGVNYSQSELGGCFGQGCKVSVGYDFADGDDNPNDCDTTYFHGSNVAAIAAGTRGVAVDANIAALKVFSGNCVEAADSDINESLNWVVKNRTAYNIAVVNLSLGFYGQGYSSTCDRDIPGSFTPGINAAYEAGVLVVAAAGNDGFPDEVSYPSCLKNAVSVANAYDARIPPLTWTGADFSCTDKGIVADMIACSSNGGSLVDLAAPGAMIQAAGVTIGGTSQASPHVAGAAALLFQANANSEPDELLTALLDTSDTVEDTRSTSAGPYVYPRVNVNDALTDFDFDPDADGDGFPYDQDCNNSDAAVNPDATEVCNGVDDDCDSKVDNLTDSDADGYSICDDCDDKNAEIHPNNVELDDNIDNDCDEVVDEGFESGGCSCGEAEEPGFSLFPILGVGLFGFQARRRRKASR